MSRGFDDFDRQFRSMERRFVHDSLGSSAFDYDPNFFSSGIGSGFGGYSGLRSRDFGIGPSHRSVWGFGPGYRSLGSTGGITRTTRDVSPGGTVRTTITTSKSLGGRPSVIGGPSFDLAFLRGRNLRDRFDDWFSDDFDFDFDKIDRSDGRVLGAQRGHEVFGLTAKDNVLGDIGKRYLNKLLSGNYKRKALVPFVAPDHPPESAQDFVAIRDQCLKDKELFEDPAFPANDRTLFYSRSPPCTIDWKRPGEITQDPRFLVEENPKFDLLPGELGDWWFPAAGASLSLRQELFYRVVPPNQSFTDNYAGIFHFQFWQYGQWIDVVIDDRLPTRKGKLLYTHSAKHQEFWPALLEKAYAKLCGGYENLKDGTTAEALEDFTGGIVELFDRINTNPPQNLEQLLFKAFDMGSLLACSIPGAVSDEKLPNGLVVGHVYNVTGLTKLETANGKVSLIRLRNLWHKDTEWNGPWSDGSQEWARVSAADKKSIGLVFEHDGEFWMSMDDFKQNFETLIVCNLGPEVSEEVAEMLSSNKASNSSVPKWCAHAFDGKWLKGKSAGGNSFNTGTFHLNPQFSFTLTGEEGTTDKEGKNICVIGLLQKNRRPLLSLGGDFLPIGFVIHGVDNPLTTKLDARFLSRHQPIDETESFINLREVCYRLRLGPGTYVIIPSTFEADQEGEFLVRIFTDGPSTATRLGSSVSFAE